jgi:hypothetical protein
MAVVLLTTDSRALLTQVRALVTQCHIATWSYDADGDFTHTAAGGQWKNKAWLRPRILSDRLTMNIIRPETGSVTREVYAVYHGRFLEMAIAHVPRLFTAGSATPFATSEDLP